MFSGIERKLCSDCTVSGADECAALEDVHCFRADVYRVHVVRRADVPWTRGLATERGRLPGDRLKGSGRKSDFQPPWGPPRR